MNPIKRFWKFLFGSGWGKKQSPRWNWVTVPDSHFNCRCAALPGKITERNPEIFGKSTLRYPDSLLSIDDPVITTRSEGAKAFTQGVSFGRNPHNQNVKISMAWNAGWLAARDKRLRDDENWKLWTPKVGVTAYDIWFSRQQLKTGVVDD